MKEKGGELRRIEGGVEGKGREGEEGIFNCSMYR